MIYQCKFGAIVQLSVRCGVQNMIYQCKFGAILQLSVRMWSSKHDLSVQIWSHLSVVSKDLEIKT